MQQIFKNIAEKRGLELLLGREAVSASNGFVICSDGGRVPCDEVHLHLPSDIHLTAPPKDLSLCDHATIARDVVNTGFPAQLDLFNSVPLINHAGCRSFGAHMPVRLCGSEKTRRWSSQMKGSSRYGSACLLVDCRALHRLHQLLAKLQACLQQSSNFSASSTNQLLWKKRRTQFDINAHRALVEHK